MTKEPAALLHATQLTHPTHHFGMHFSSTPRGARLARRLVAVRLDEWGYPYDTAVHDDVTLIVAELCANAVRHRHVPGRDFRLELTVTAPGVLRIAVTDTRSEVLPAPAVARRPLADAGRGLHLVAALAHRWDWGPRPEGGPGKTVWADYRADPVP
ncbi:ATP-binding protein [Streptomyces mirabilis]|uniref:ATP-binding protein n=1 Tax=Streptomyces mirabilis TaxID=68239 RepID=UPI00382201F3